MLDPRESSRLQSTSHIENCVSYNSESFHGRTPILQEDFIRRFDKRLSFFNLETSDVGSLANPLKRQNYESSQINQNDNNYDSEISKR